MEPDLLTNPLVAVFATFGGGVLASLSPCVYPMVPILSSYILSGQGATPSRLRALLLSLSYTSGMAIVYAALGMIAAMSGQLFGAIATNGLTLLIVGLLFCFFSLNIFGLVPLPALRFKQGSQAPRSLFGAWIMGAASGLVASPCTSPVLFGLLGYVASTQNLYYGAALLFAFAMGMGVLLILAGTFSVMVASRPRPGTWMVRVHFFMGVIMLAFGGYYILRAFETFA